MSYVSKLGSPIYAAALSAAATIIIIYFVLKPTTSDILSLSLKIAAVSGAVIYVHDLEQKKVLTNKIGADNRASDIADINRLSALNVPGAVRIPYDNRFDMSTQSAQGTQSNQFQR